MKRIKKLGWGLLMAALTVNLFIGQQIFSEEAAPEENGYAQMKLYTTVLEKVRQDYVSQDKTHYKELVYSSLRGMLGELDPYSQFMEPVEHSDMVKDTTGEFGGLGIYVGVRDGVLVVIAPMEGSPAFEAGILPGDAVTRIDGKEISDFEPAEAISMLRGKIGSAIELEILRPDTRELLNFELTRALIEVPSIKDAEMLDPEIGYLRIVQFDNKTSKELRTKLKELKNSGMRGLVIDLRNNPGGVLGAAVNVCGQFLKRGQEIVVTKGRDSKINDVYRNRRSGKYQDLLLVLLVNGGSASAAEIVSGALQDHQRAVLIGEKTYGKGSVQTIFPLEDGSALRLTTAKYYTPSRREIHERGIEPDIFVPLPPQEWARILRSRNRRGIDAPAADEEALEDEQLERALTVLRGLLLFNDTSNED